MSSAVTTQDDEVSLREALALFNDWDDEFESFFVPVSRPSPRCDERTQRPGKRLQRTTSAPTAYSRKRDARLATLVNLQLQANELERVLRTEQARLVGPPAAPITSTALQQECVEIVIRQKRQRVTAATENAALRECVSREQAIARRMMKLAQNAASIRDFVGHARVPSLAQYQGPVMNIPQHLQYLDSRMDDARVLLSSGMFEENSGRDFQCVRFRDLGFDGLQVEFGVSWVVPFGIDAVASVLWPLLTGAYHKGRRTGHELTHSSADLVCTSFVSEPPASGQLSCNHGQAISGITHGQSAVRRYGKGHDDSRILVTRIRAGIFDETSKGKRKGDMSGDGWLQVEPVPSRVTATTPQVSRIKWCNRVTGRPINHDTTPLAQRAQWVHSVVAGPMRCHWEKNLTLKVQTIENLLMEEMATVSC